MTDKTNIICGVILVFSIVVQVVSFVGLIKECRELAAENVQLKQQISCEAGK
ncbi:hypothetical protein ACXHVK_003225 [Morganella morganii]|nr:hypothetical protein [Morganella morganii]